MPQLKDKVSSFFSWARKGRGPVSVDVTRREEGDDSGGGSKEVTLHQLKQGYSEVVETMKSVRSHLEEQSGRSEQMLSLMQDLPEVLRSIPEGARTQTRMLEAIHANLQQQNETSTHLTTAITGLASAAASQEKALSQISDHLTEEKDTRGQLNEGVATLNTTLGHVMDSNAATRDSMGAVVEQTRVNDERMRQMYQRSQKMNTAMVLLCLALATGALALGGYMAFLVNKVVNEPTATSSPSPTAPAAPAEATPAAAEAVTGSAATPATETPVDPVSQPASTSAVPAEAEGETSPAEGVSPSAPDFSAGAYRIEPTPVGMEVPDSDLYGPPAP
ncbi:MAG: hypothetical protein AAF333_17310 [Planctomycetota bacterium]